VTNAAKQDGWRTGRCECIRFIPYPGALCGTRGGYSERLPAHWFAQPHESLDALLRVLKQVIRRAPLPRFAEYNNGGATEAKHGLFFATLERGIERMNLDDSSNRQGPRPSRSQVLPFPADQET
jgi:hypothetical protein